MFKPALDKYELFWEKSLDTKCLLAWNRQHIVLAFRGTASLSNVKADVQVCLPSWEAWRLCIGIICNTAKEQLSS